MQFLNTQTIYKHWAFIYCAAGERIWAQWLQRRLESYPIPEYLIGKPTADGAIPDKVAPIHAELDAGGSEEFSPEIVQRLRHSRYLIVVCSPSAAASRHADAIIRTFKSFDREHRVLCLIVGGEPYASSRLEPTGEECLPRAVKYQVNSAREITDVPAAPFAADARPHRDGKRSAFLRILAGIIRADYDEIKDRDYERQQRKLLRVMISALVLVIFFAGIAIWAFGQHKSSQWELKAAQEHILLLEQKLDDRAAQ